MCLTWVMLFMICLTNRFHLAMRVSSDNKQMTSKRGRNHSYHELRNMKKYATSRSQVFLPRFNVFYELSEYTCTAIWNLFALYVVLELVILLRSRNKRMFVVICMRRTLQLITSLVRLYYNHILPYTNQNARFILSIVQLGITHKKATQNNKENRRSNI